jgi:hypothetical protein
MYLPMSEVHKKYNGQWIFMINCTTNERGSVTGGEVVLHNENRDNVIRKMDKYSYEPSPTYFRYAGEIPKEVSVIL